MFITFEGCDGAGKSTQIRELYNKLVDIGLDVVVTREPGGTNFGEIVRNILLDPQGPNRTALAELFLYSASRAELVAKVIKPALDEGRIVISERYIDSTWVYQGYAGGISVCDIEIINTIATGNLVPDLTLILDVSDPRIIQHRLAFKRKDKIESRDEDYHTKVREGYRKLAGRFFHRIKVIDASLPCAQVKSLVWNEVREILKKRGYHFVK